VPARGLKIRGPRQVGPRTLDPNRAKGSPDRGGRPMCQPFDPARGRAAFCAINTLDAKRTRSCGSETMTTAFSTRSTADGRARSSVTRVRERHASCLTQHGDAAAVTGRVFDSRRERGVLVSIPQERVRFASRVLMAQNRGTSARGIDTAGTSAPAAIGQNLFARFGSRYAAPT